MNEREKILTHIVAELSKIPDLFDQIEQSTKSKDGRNKSMEGGEIVANLITNVDFTGLSIPGGSIKEAPPRHWYDFGNENFPVNEKITGGKSADNTSSKEGLYFSLTGYPPKELPNNRWNTYFEALNKGLQQRAPDINDKDYYFLVLDKKSKSIFWNAYRQIPELGTPNGSNLPHQIKWSDKNRLRISRSLDDATKFLMSNFVEALEKSAIPYNEYHKHSWQW